MDDHLVCSDLCEEHGFQRQAELLRAIADGGRTAYVVMERGAEYNDEITSPNEEGEPVTVFLDRAEAERAAAERDAAWHRSNNILDFCYTLREVTDLPTDTLERRISEILGRPYHLPNEGQPTYSWSEQPLVPEPVTDEQMLQIADLFKLKFFYVVETQFARPDRELPLSFESTPKEDQP